jgi:hypothetical protein
MDSDEFNRLLKNVPLDKKENIKYPEFLSQFDAGRENKSLFAPTEYTSASRARPVKKRKTEGRKKKPKVCPKKPETCPNYEKMNSTKFILN